MKRTFRLPVLLFSVQALAVGFCLLVGCQQGEEVVKESVPVESDRLECLANLYRLHQIQNNGYGPLDRREFVEFVSKQPPRSLKRIGVDPSNVENLFISDVDGELFEIRYGVVGNEPDSRQAIVLEASGVQGKRRVAFSSGAMEMVTSESIYSALLSGKNK